MRGLTLFVLILGVMQSAMSRTWHSDSIEGREMVPANFKDRFVFKTAGAANESEEKTFNKILRPSDTPGLGEGFNLYGSGRSFLEQLELVSRDQCIPRLLVLSHGWGPSRVDGGMGLPIIPSRITGQQNTSQDSGSLASYPAAGFYLNEATRSAEVIQSHKEIIEGIELSLYTAELAERFKAKHKRDITERDRNMIRLRMLNLYDPNAVPGDGYRLRTADDLYAAMEAESKKNSIEMKDLQKSIGQNKTRFCASRGGNPGCKIEFYSCNLHADFVKNLALTTGCEITYGTGMVSYHSGDKGVVTVRADRSSKKVTIERPKKDKNGNVIRDANGKVVMEKVVDYINENNRDGQFVRVTPQSNGTIKEPEKIGYRHTFK